MQAPPAQERELLAASAPLALRLSRELCRGDRADEESCAWLHGFWQCLRLAGLAASPDRHAAFFQRALRVADAVTPRVLISGAADYCMLGLVAAALQGRAGRTTVVDACETPLELNRWYAARAGLAVTTQRCSILDCALPDDFDVICTHSFFGQFSQAERPGLAAAWHRLLRRGGRVVTAHPLRPFGGDEPNRFTPAQERIFRGRIAAEAGRLAEVLGVEETEVTRLGERYLRARYGYPVRSADELAALFEGAGFEMEELTCEAAPPDAPPGSGGPGLRNPDVHYAHVIARRR